MFAHDKNGRTINISQLVSGHWRENHWLGIGLDGTIYVFDTDPTSACYPIVPDSRDCVEFHCDENGLYEVEGHVIGWRIWPEICHEPLVSDNTKEGDGSCLMIAVKIGRKWWCQGDSFDSLESVRKRARNHIPQKVA